MSSSGAVGFHCSRELSDALTFEDDQWRAQGLVFQVTVTFTLLKVDDARVRLHGSWHLNLPRQWTIPRHYIHYHPLVDDVKISFSYFPRFWNAILGSGRPKWCTVKARKASDYSASQLRQ